MPAVKFVVRLDLDQNPSFLDGNYLTTTLSPVGNITGLFPIFPFGCLFGKIKASGIS